MRVWGFVILLLIAATAFASTSSSRDIDPLSDASEAPGGEDTDSDDFDDDWVPEERAELLTLMTRVEADEVVVKLQHLAVSGIDRPPCVRAS